MHDLDGLVPHLQIAQSASVHQEHFSLGFTAQILGVVAHSHFDGLLRLAHATLAVGDERQIIQETVHTERGAELTQGKLVITLTVCHEGKRLAGEIDAGSLAGHPLGMFEGQLRVALLKRVRGKNVQTNVFRMFLRQATQAFAIVGGEHTPFDALRHLRLIRTTMRVRVLRGEAHRAIGIAARLGHVLATLLLTVGHLLFASELATLLALLLVAILVEVTALIVTTEILTIAITEVTAAAITTIIATVVIAVEVTTIAITTEVTTLAITVIAAFTVTMEIPAIVVAVEVFTVSVTSIVTTETGTLAIALVARIVSTTATIIAMIVTTLAVTVELARTVMEAALLAFPLTVTTEIAVAAEIAAIALAVTALMIVVVEAAGLVSVGLAAIATRLESFAAAIARLARAVGLVVAVGLAARSALFFCHAVPYIPCIP